MAVFLVIVFAVFSLFLKGVDAEKQGGALSAGAFSNPSLNADLALLTGMPSLGVADQLPLDASRGSLATSYQPLFSSLPAPSGLMPYTIARADTFSKIAAKFGTTIAQIKAVNPGVRTPTRGLQIYIPQTQSAFYSVRGGDSPELIAAHLGVDLSRLLAANPFVNFNSLVEGAILAIPGADPSRVASISSDTAYTSLPVVVGYFVQPVQGVIGGTFSKGNTVDIVNVCGTPIAAAAEGLVSAVALTETGNGHSLTIDHPNGTKTHYAHMDAISVSVGDYVTQNQKLGTMGKTGDTAGCRLDFSVDGAKNPFAKK